MYTFIIVVIGLIGLLMSIVILLQSGRGTGLAGIAAGESTRQVLGARQAPDLLEKATWTLATMFIVLAILANFAIDRGGQSDSIIQEEAQQQGTPQQNQQQPALPGQGQQGPGQQQGQQGQQPVAPGGQQNNGANQNAPAPGDQ
jgi:preprotein translocase subunit SecG